MNHLSKMPLKLMAVVQILAITLLASCATVADAATAPTTACHATGDPANPYVEINIANDISPVPVNGCPAVAALVSNGMITICHATGKEATPYNEVTVSVNGLNGHGTHEGDIITSPEEGCPQGAANASAANNNLSICHLTGDASNPYEEITFQTSAELKAYRAQNPEDISPAPINGCPETLAVVVNGKVAICHATSGETNPYNEIEISVNGLNGHGEHEGDLIPAPEDGCPAALTTSADKVTICHATGSDKNPYNEITISVSGLSGHNGHDGDIIPAPAGGCPAKKK